MHEYSDRDMLLAYISDTHKDAYGYRPRYDFGHLSVEELRNILAGLQETVEWQIREEEEREAEEARKTAELAERFGVTVETMQRWMDDASEDYDYDDREAYAA